MTDVLKLLPHLQWRGVVYPVVSREVSFTHEGVRHKLQYRDGELIEQTGAQALTFTYGIPMREDIAKGPYKNLFTEGLPRLFRDCLNRTVDEMYDPVYGPFTCFPTSYRDSTDVQKRDGTDIVVEFTRTLTDADEDPAPDAPTVQGVASQAGLLDADLAADGTFVQFMADQGMPDFLTGLAGSIAMLKGNVDRAQAAALDVASKMRVLDRQLTIAENPQLWGLQNTARNVRDSANSLAAHGADPKKRVVTVTQNYSKTIGAVALQAGMSSYELLVLNPALAAKPVIPKGFRVRVYG